MPSEIMDQRRVSPLYVPPVSSSFFSDEIRFPAQRQVGFWKSEMVSDNLGPGRMPLASGKIISSSPSEKLLIKEQNSQLRLEQLIGVDRTGRLSMTPWKSASHGLGSQCNGKEQQVMFPQPSSLNAKENGIDMTGIPYDSGLFSSSLPGLLSKKFTQGPLFDLPIGTFNSNFDDGPFESLKEIEAQTIGNLLPDDDDLFSGVIDNVGVEHVSPTNNSDDVEDDIFYSGGGMELDANGVRNGYRAVENNIFGGEYALSAHPSRALLVNNIEKSIDDNDLKVLFERHGDIHMLYTTYKHRGFVIICYYDLRAACSAMRELQNKIVMHQNLDVHFVTSKIHLGGCQDTSSGRNINQRIVLVSNLDSSVSKDYLNKIFGVYGEIKEIHEIPQKCGYKFVEFYDTRAAEAAFRTLNRNNIVGKIIQLELLHPEFAAHLMQKSSHEMKQEEAGLCFRKGSPPNSSTSMYYGRMPLGGVASGSLDNSAIQGQLSISHGSVSSHLENAFNGISSCGPHYQSSPVTVGHIGSHSNQQRMDDLNNSLGQLNFGLKCVPSFHPHSLPEYHNGPTDSVPYQPPNTMSSMTLNFIAHADGVDTMHVPGLNSGGLSCPSFLSSEQASGSTNGVSQGHQYIWNNHSSQHHCPPGHLMWPNSPSCMNNAHSPSQLLHRLPTAPSTVLSSAPSTYHHNVGSAPTGNPSMWDRHHSYKGDSREASFFHPGSLGHMGFSGSPLHQREFASHNIFSQVGGNCIEKSLSSTHVGFPSPQQNHRMFYACRNPMIPAPTTFESPVDRIRSRRSDANSTQVDSKRQYELDIERIVREEDKRTTLMIKNIPNKYTSKMLLAAIDENHRGTYDFIYLPIDFKNKCNVGYAFINLVDPQQIIPFYKAFNGKKWEKFNSEKVASLAYARIQGKTALIAHFQNSSLMNEDKRCRPILFHSDGPNAGDQEPFPLGMNIRSRSGRARTQNSEDNPQGSPSNSASGEDCSSGFNLSTSCSIKDT